MQSEYKFENSGNDASHRYLLQKIETALKSLSEAKENLSVLDFGCGNGSMTRDLAEKFPNIHFRAVDPSPAAQSFHKDHVLDNLTFLDWKEFEGHKSLKIDVVLSVEVIEHVFLPRVYLEKITYHLTPNGFVILTTPYHGYFKNLSIAILGRFDQHFTALWDYGHIKFWSVNTIKKLFEEYNFKVVCFSYCGRFFPLSKSMLAIFKR